MAMVRMTVKSNFKGSRDRSAAPPSPVAAGAAGAAAGQAEQGVGDSESGSVSGSVAAGGEESPVKTQQQQQLSSPSAQAKRRFSGGAGKGFVANPMTEHMLNQVKHKLKA